jgi:DUF4097 and DUF4098 domain-containing protein YvlB
MKTSKLFGALFLTACLCAHPQRTLAGKVQEEFHQTYSLSSNGLVRLQNINGKVRFTTWEKQQVQVDAIKRANRQADLDAVTIEVDAKPDRLRIDTKYPKFSWGRKSNSTSVDYEIKVPAHVRLNDVVTVNGDIEVDGVHGQVRTTTVNGRIRLHGLAADAHLESVNGSLEAVFETFDDVDSVSLKSVNGKIDVSLPAMANANVSANTLSGTIRTDSALTVKRHMVGSDVRGKIGQGGGAIRAETINGGIRILREEGPKNARIDAAPRAKTKLEED